ncbi:MAG TPA: response regulator [Candidatus Sulfotelmatobacter sp.]|nr:response regulator [Candidatus Sulfotelmatobacter sp.]
MKKILIVDDSVGMVRMIQSVLEKEGYKAIGISDPSQVEKTIDSEAPSLILLDVVMPERNGFQVCRALKNSQAYKSIPVIVVSGKSTPSDRYWAEQQGANGYVAKPFDPAELLREVRRFA